MEICTMETIKDNFDKESTPDQAGEQVYEPFDKTAAEENIRQAKEQLAQDSASETQEGNESLDPTWAEKGPALEKQISETLSDTIESRIAKATADGAEEISLVDTVVIDPSQKNYLQQRVKISNLTGATFSGNVFPRKCEDISDEMSRSAFLEKYVAPEFQEIYEDSDNQPFKKEILEAAHSSQKSIGAELAEKGYKVIFDEDNPDVISKIVWGESSKAENEPTNPPKKPGFIKKLFQR